MIIGTAGHIDHGKTALVQRLTGIDTDRLPEEKRRGMTIELGFAHLDLDGIGRIGMVDVPGHERFIRNMVAGATGMDVVLLAVAADDGIMPQTLEHLDIVSMLGITRAVVALNKIDLVSATRVSTVANEIHALLGKTMLATAPVISVSARTGEGVEDLRAALAQAVRSEGARKATGYFRLPIDRAFVMPGFGPVVTGTIAAGETNRNARVRLLPGGQEARVRGVQTHNRQVETARAGDRCALNLAGIGIEALARGMMVVDPRLARLTQAFDAWLTIAPHASQPPKNGQRVRVHAGTAECFARLAWLDEGVPGPAEGAFVQIRLEEPQPLLYGDRFILRSGEARYTLGGGVVLDPFSARRALRSAERRERLARLRSIDIDVALDVWLEARGAAGWLMDELGEQLAEPPDRLAPRLTARADIVREETGGVTWIALAREIESLAPNLLRAIASYLAAHPDMAAMPAATLHQVTCPRIDRRVFRLLLAQLAAERRIEQTAEGVRPAGHRQRSGARDSSLAGKIETVLAGRGGTPPKLEALAETVGVPVKQLTQALGELVRGGSVVKIADGVYVTRVDIEAWRAQAARLLAEKGTLSLGEFRDAIGAGRGLALQVLEHFDRHGITRRKGDVRIAALSQARRHA